MTWDDISEEEILEWRKSPVTLAFKGLLGKYAETAAENVLAASVRDAATRTELSRLGGEKAGLSLAIQLLEKS